MSRHLTFAEIVAQCVEVGDCLEWQGRMGYGGDAGKPIYKRYNGRYSASVPVCREVWTLTRGAIPAGKIVYRTCCNDRCVGCLALGVRGDAMRQRKKLGLSSHSPATRAALTLGARNRATAKYSMEEAREVRSLVAAGLKFDEIAERTGVHRDAVADMRHRTWQETSYAASVFNWRPA